MDKKTIGDWIMYYEINRMLREGLSRALVAKTMGTDPRTVKKYAGMSESAYEAFLVKRESRTKLLTAYEAFVKDRLIDSPAASAAQVHDWLKEHHSAFPKTSPKTVYNFVMAIRQRYNIPLEKPERDYFPVDQLAYGLQAQVDFGQYHLRSSDRGRKKVYFFVMMLSRSRMKYVYFLDKPFTTDTTIEAHENAFQYFGGVTREVVYDQDRIFIVQENLGELLLTKAFKEYVFERGFQLYFCRKADPQSKGKVENVVGYIKHNFLYGRLYHDIDTLQSEALGWLIRTGNGMPHATTKLIPLQELINEKPHLRGWVTVNLLPSYLLRIVRKDNTINYGSNLYSVPQGTYNKSSEVRIRLSEDQLIIHDLQDKFICRHLLASGNGKTVINTDHKRDKSGSINDLVTLTAALFDNEVLATQYLELIRKDKGRYVRDHLQAIRAIVSGQDKNQVNQVLQKCMEEKYLSANMFKELMLKHQKEGSIKESSMEQVNPLNGECARKAETRPDKSDLETYEKVFGTADPRCGAIKRDDPQSN